MRAAVTGSSGFIGAALVSRLVRDGWGVLPVARAEIDAFLNDLPKLSPDVVFHIAGITQSTDVALFYESNTVLAARVLDAASRVRKPPRVILVGSAAEYGTVPQQAVPVSEDYPCNPITDYAISKYAQTLMARRRALTGADLVVARIWNPVGPLMPNHLALGSFAAQIKNMPSAGGVLNVGNLEVERDFIDVEEVARILMELSHLESARGQVVNVCSGHAWKLLDLVDRMIGISGRSITLKIDQSRLRLGETTRLFGAITRLQELGINPAKPDFRILLHRLMMGST